MISKSYPEQKMFFNQKINIKINKFYTSIKKSIFYLPNLRNLFLIKKFTIKLKNFSFMNSSKKINIWNI